MRKDMGSRRDINMMMACLVVWRWLALIHLLFNWTETWDHNVREIATNEEYDSCSSDPGIVLGPGVRTVLNSTTSRFFICTVGDHREQGQKVSITVGSPTTSSLLAPPPPSSHASSLTTTTLRTFVGLIPTLVAVISFVA
ncbi:hypothetical protein C1H46_012060 [Malus baccata]|uniref:Phytocyanin domain-containing protein n=1 Tax=Malus baccata TaxID=106549 RepID=A0A540MU53_MALBA|nr:hypothetical protein C1H46_012060 [Malus baccata]